MDDEYDDDLLEPSYDDVRSTWRDLVIDDEFESKLVELCAFVIPNSEEAVTDVEQGGEQLLALALVAVADLPPRRGRSVSAETVAPGGPEIQGNVFWFYVARRLDVDGRTRLRIWVPRTTDETWLAEFDGDRLTVLEREP